MKNLLLLFLLLAAGPLTGQTPTLIVDSLRLPAGIEADASGRLWVVEAGYGFNDGAVTLVEANGTAWPVIVGLPSFFDTSSHENVGPWHTLQLPGNRLAVAEGASGQVLIFDLTGFIPGVSAALTPASSTTTLDISTFVLAQGFAESNPYSIARDAGGNLYVADAAANAIVKVTPAGQMSVFATFAGFPNPMPLGPPVIDPVPTRILAKPGGGFYVSQLTGFPFLDQAANVFFVDANGSVSPYATGLTQLTDLALDANTGDLYALQVGKFVLDPMQPPGYAPNSAKVTRIKADGTKETVAENFDLSAGIALDGQGNLYTTELGNGTLLKWNSVATAVREAAPILAELTLAPNPAPGATRISFSLQEATPVRISVLDAAGRMIFEQSLGRLDAGAHSTDWQATGQPAGLYWVEIQTARETRRLQLILQ